MFSHTPTYEAAWGDIPCGVVANVSGLRQCSKRVQTPVPLLRSFSDYYSEEMYEHPIILPAMG